VGRNERTRYGEIDLIAFDGQTLVFAEVKTRRVNTQRQAFAPISSPSCGCAHVSAHVYADSPPRGCVRKSTFARAPTQSASTRSG
jgi:Holliday junction resolvase-like predicted endonuclease